MKRTLKSARNPVWANKDQTAIDVLVVFEEIPEELPFTATPNDTHEHGRNLYAEILAGNYGEIAPYPEAREAANIRFIRDELLLALDAIVSNPLRWASFSQETQQAYTVYRQALLDVPQQAGFPWNVTWPTKP